MAEIKDQKNTETFSEVFVLHPAIQNDRPLSHTLQARLAEAISLSEAISLKVVFSEAVVVRKPRPATLYGTGIVDTYKNLIKEYGVNLVFVDGQISPVQQRNLEKIWNVKVLDRTGLILEIFGDRARTAEGVLQVELASLSYQKSRLVRTWTHLERQRGSLGNVGGPGEKQLEMDRRLIAERIAKLTEELAGVKRTRELHRQARRRVPYPIVALVGYTNAGKSTLFNRLTHSKVLAEDLLFATLDPTMRRLTLPSGRQIILSDTVGFISDLPTQLIAAFRATLEEVLEATLLVHVRDSSHPQSLQQKKDVDGILSDLGMSAVLEEGGLLEALNKVDCLENRDSLDAILDKDHLAMSALTGEGVDQLLQRIDERLGAQDQELTLILDYEDGARLAWLYENGHVIDRQETDAGILIVVRLSPDKVKKLKAIKV